MFVLTVAASLASLTLGTTQVAADLSTLSQGADAIVHAKVIESHARRTQDGMRIITDTTLQVTESLKGDAKPETQVIVMQPGGVVGEIGQRVEGAATFKPGEEVVLFLEKRGDRFTMVGMSQGKFTIEKASDGKATFAIPNAEHAGLLVDPETHQPIASPLVTLELSKLKAQISQSLQNARPAPKTTRP
ncbi:MAG: hypothetical protein QM723_06950 [Myxococcaceae bacterium]